MIRIKICCISSLEEARTAAAAGAHHIGLVSRMPSGPGVIPEARIRTIAAAAPRGVESVLLTAERDPRSIARQHARCGAGALQLVDRLPQGALGELRTLVGATPLMAVIHVGGEASILEAREAARHADRLLLDSGDTGLEIKELGGTGRTHDWAVSRAIVEAVTVPVFLAGGLRPDNVMRAVESVRPAGVDVCSGVRTGGRLDPALLAAFVTAVGQGSPASA